MKVNPKFVVRSLIATLLVASAVVLTTNNSVQQAVLGKLGTQYVKAVDPNTFTEAIVCNVPIGHLVASAITIIKSNPHGVCLGGLVLGQGAPILGDRNRVPVINPYAKYNKDLLATVANDILICQVPCTNGFAFEIMSCNDLSGTPALQSYSIDAQGVC